MHYEEIVERIFFINFHTTFMPFWKILYLCYYSYIQKHFFKFKEIFFFVTDDCLLAQNFFLKFISTILSFFYLFFELVIYVSMYILNLIFFLSKKCTHTHILSVFEIWNFTKSRPAVQFITISGWCFLGEFVSVMEVKKDYRLILATEISLFFKFLIYIRLYISRLQKHRAVFWQLFSSLKVVRLMKTDHSTTAK